MNSLDRVPAKQVVDGTSQGRSHSDNIQEYTAVKNKKIKKILKNKIHSIRPNHM